MAISLGIYPIFRYTHVENWSCKHGGAWQPWSNAMEKWPFIVDLPIHSMVIFHSYVKLPEGRINVANATDSSKQPWKICWQDVVHPTQLAQEKQWRISAWWVWPKIWGPNIWGHPKIAILMVFFFGVHTIFCWKSWRCKGYPLVNCYILQWKDPPCYFHGKIHYFNGYKWPFSSSQTVSSPEGTLLSYKAMRVKFTKLTQTRPLGRLKALHQGDKLGAFPGLGGIRGLGWKWIYKPSMFVLPSILGSWNSHWNDWVIHPTIPAMTYPLVMSK